MRRRLATLAAASALVIALAASPALAAGGPATRDSGPLAHDIYPAEYLGELCGYTFQPGGYFTDVYRPGDIGEDGTIHSAHITLHGVWATNAAGDLFRVLGMEAYTDGWGATAKLMFVRKGGGIVTTINIVVRDGPNGGFLHDIGTCSWI